MPLHAARRQTSSAQRPAASAWGAASCRLRATAQAFRRWWAEERHYRPERHYMRG